MNRLISRDESKRLATCSANTAEALRHWGLHVEVGIDNDGPHLTVSNLKHHGEPITFKVRIEGYK